MPQEGQLIPNPVLPTFTIEVLTADDSSGLFFTPIKGVWTEYYIKNSYFTDGHRYQMGVASPGGFLGASVAFVQTTAPTLLWQCDWIAAMENQSPVIPSPTLLNDPGWVFLDQDIEPEQMELGVDGGTYIYSVRGTYWFGHTNPSAAQLVYSIAPWFNDAGGVALRIISNLQTQGYLIDAPQTIPNILPPSAGALN
jgi:hypothetical protein